MTTDCLSIITNFGCHYKCPYCVVKKNGLLIPKTTMQGLDGLESAIREYGIKQLSISGGGDPLYKIDEHKAWYQRVFQITIDNNVPISVHTSYMTSKVDFPFQLCEKVVYHANSIDDLNEIERCGHEKVRVVFVVTEDFTKDYIEKICDFVEERAEIDQISFRQLAGENYEPKYYLHDYLLAGHKKRWYYITQDDYNLYYAENKVYTRFRDFAKEATQ